MPSSVPVRSARPLSPHLQIYKPQLTTMLSILHRITGVGISFGMIVFVLWLVALAGGPDSYQTFCNYAHSVIGQIALCGLSFAFIYHFCNGIRHLLWDMGFLLDLPDVYRSGYAVTAATVLLTALLWLHVTGTFL